LINVGRLIVPLRITVSHRAVISGVTLELVLDTSKVWLTNSNVAIVGIFAVCLDRTRNMLASFGIRARISGTDIVIITVQNRDIVAPRGRKALPLDTFGNNGTAISIGGMAAMFGVSQATIGVADIQGTSVAIIAISGSVANG